MPRFLGVNGPPVDPRGDGPRDPGPHHEKRRAERELSNKEKVLKSLNVGVLGARCVALVTGTCLAHIGHQVTCINKDDERIAGLTEGRIRRGLVQQANVLFIAVDTPQGEGGSVDLSNVAAVARGIGRPSTDGGFPREHLLDGRRDRSPLEQSQLDPV